MPGKRQLLAILFADIQGYTALVQQNETTARIIKEKFTKVVEVDFKNHHGRVVQFLGDGVLCIFKSAVDAVLAAIDVQQKMLQEPMVPLRIGIHLGDVIVEGKDVFGDGVNIASRVESFAVPGSVLISNNVFREIRNHPDIKVTLLGKYEFKNVSEFIDLYAISNTGLVVPRQKNLTGKGIAHSNKRYWVLGATVLLIFISAIFLYFNLLKGENSEKSIAVLPFLNLSNIPDEEYLSDGFTEDILTSISNISGFKITSFTSTRQYKGSTKSIRQIANELNVDYILEGSVQRSGDKLRITAQLIKADNDAHIWAKNYDESFSEILSIQTKVANEVATAMETKLSPGEKYRIETHATLNTDAYQLYLKGRYYWNLRTKAGLDSSLHFFLSAIKSDPDYALAYSGVADAYTVLCDNGYLPVDSVETKAKFAIAKAMELDSSLPEVRASLAIYLSSIEGNGLAAIQQLKKVIDLNPNYASAFQWYAIEVVAKGRFQDAEEMIEKAIVLDPRSQRIYYTKALIFLFARDIEKSINVLQQSPDGFSTEPSYIGFLSNLFYLKGQKDSAAYYARLSGNEVLMSILKGDISRVNKLINNKTKEKEMTAEEIASLFAFANEKDSAFVWLNKSIANKEYSGLKFLAVNPFYDPLRSDPRFDLILQNSGVR